MINNPTPEEKAWWDRQMDKHPKKRVASPTRAAAIIFALISLIAGVATCHEVRDQPSPDHSSLDSGWVEEHSEKADTIVKPAPAPYKLHWPVPSLKHKEDTL